MAKKQAVRMNSMGPQRWDVVSKQNLGKFQDISGKQTTESRIKVILGNGFPDLNTHHERG